MKVGIPRAVIDVARPVVALMKERDMSKTKTGKGVDALFEQERQEKRAKAREAERRYEEKRKAARAATSLAGVPGDHSAVAKRRERDARAKREKRAALKEAVAIVGAEIAKPASERVKLDVDEPVPVRLTLTGLAKAYADACSEVAIQEGVLDHALNQRAKARKALDNAADRLANGDA